MLAKKQATTREHKAGLLLRSRLYVLPNALHWV